LGTPLRGHTKIDDKGVGIELQSMHSGYSIVQAESEAAAVEMLKSHPHLGWWEGVSIEVYECMAM